MRDLAPLVLTKVCLHCSLRLYMYRLNTLEAEDEEELDLARESLKRTQANANLSPVFS